MHRVVPSTSGWEPIVDAVRSVRCIFYLLLQLPLILLVVLLRLLLALILIFLLLLGLIVLALYLRCVTWVQKRFCKFFQVRIVVEELFICSYRINLHVLAILKL